MHRKHSHEPIANEYFDMSKYVELDSKLIHSIQKLGHMDETIPEFIEKMVDHVLSCQEWWEKRDDCD